VIDVSETTLNVAAGLFPKLTTVAPVKLVPVIVTIVPPAVGPLVGDTLVTVGAATYVNSSAGEIAETPPGVVTVTSTVPADPAGAVAVIDVSEMTVNVVAGLFPKLTAVAPVKLVPVIVTIVPPAVDPLVGDRLVTVGAATYVNSSAGEIAETPPGAVTVTSTVPTDPAGAVAVIDVSETTLNVVAGLFPKLTAVAPVKLVPVIVTIVPPAVGPLVGEMLVTLGAAIYVN
jgi:hypothetical protein